jgi:hypothetical protein
MPRSGPRKAVVEKNDLPPLIKLGEDSYGYLVRYRVISEDRNRFSAWSPIFATPLFSFQNLPEQVDGTISVVGDTVSTVWEDEEERPGYDIFVKFDDDEKFVYHGSSKTRSYFIINKRKAVKIVASIQIQSINKEKSPVITICEVSTETEE